MHKGYPVPKENEISIEISRSKEPGRKLDLHIHTRTQCLCRTVRREFGGTFEQAALPH